MDELSFCIVHLECTQPAIGPPVSLPASAVRSMEESEGKGTVYSVGIRDIQW